MDSNVINITPKKEKPVKGGAIIAVFVLLLAFVFSINSLFLLRPNEYAVIKQFGKIVKVSDSEGLNFKIPVIQTKMILPRNILLYDVPPTEINTLDKKRIVVDYYALWRITEPINMLESLKTIEGAESRLSDIMYSNVRNELGKLEYGQIINPLDNNRGGVDEIVLNLVNEIFLANSNGIEIIDIQIKRIDLPQTNEQSVYKRMISERQSKAQEYLSQGEAEANRMRAEVDREVEEIIARAEAEAKYIVASGDKEAARIYNDAYGKDPEFFSLFRSLESYKKTIDDETVILMPVDSPYLKYLVGN